MMTSILAGAGLTGLFNISRCRIARVLFISRCRIDSVLFIKFFTFGYYAFNLKRMLLLDLGDTETNPKPTKSSFTDFFDGM